MIGQILLAHLVGDYLLQTHHMATEKVTRWYPAILHGLVYTLPFGLITQSWTALAVISLTHIIIDRYRLIRYFIWAKNQLAPKRLRFGQTATGYPKGTPDWLAVWLMFIQDNIIHILINVAAITWLV